MNTAFERSDNRTDEWYTPIWIIESLGRFDLDPCAPTNDFYTADKCYTKEDDGLAQTWDGRVWLNPPYRNPLIGRFMRRMAVHRNGIALIFNRMDTSLWHDVIFTSADAILIIRGRVRFCDIGGRESMQGAGCGSILVAWGESNVDTLKNCGINGKFIEL